MSFEKQLIEEINTARYSPKSYVSKLQKVKNILTKIFGNIPIFQEELKQKMEQEHMIMLSPF